MAEQAQVYDKNGIPIAIGDTLKVFHFIGARRKKHFVYKYVMGIKNNRFKVSHLSGDIEEYYTLKIDNGMLGDYEIVQGYGGDNCSSTNFSDRQKQNKH